MTTTVTGLTAARMETIEAASVVDGEVDGFGHLILTKHDATTIDAGSVIGPVGPSVLPGTMLNYAGASAPDGFLLCNGSSLLRAAYPDLFSVLGTTYGASDGTHFYIPDNRGWRGKSNTTTTLPASTWTKVSGFATDAGYVSQSGRYYTYSGGTFTMIAPGEYSVYGQVFFETETDGGRYIVGFWVNGSEVARHDIKVGTRGAPVMLPLNKTIRFSAGDTFEMQAYQASGGGTHDLSGSDPGHIIEFSPRGIGTIIKT